MDGKRFYLTRTALKTLRKAGCDTEKQWGKAQARKYVDRLMDGFQYIADNNKTFPRREEMTGRTGLSLSSVEHYYVTFQRIADNEITIAGIFHESMDIPSRLKELHAMTRHEIVAIQAMIAQENG